MVGTVLKRTSADALKYEAAGKETSSPMMHLVKIMCRANTRNPFESFDLIRYAGPPVELHQCVSTYRMILKCVRIPRIRENSEI